LERELRNPRKVERFGGKGGERERRKEDELYDATREKERERES